MGTAVNYPGEGETPTYRQLPMNEESLLPFPAPRAGAGRRGVKVFLPPSPPPPPFLLPQSRPPPPPGDPSRGFLTLQRHPPGYSLPSVISDVFPTHICPFPSVTKSPRDKPMSS